MWVMFCFDMILFASLFVHWLKEKSKGDLKTSTQDTSLLDKLTTTRVKFSYFLQLPTNMSFVLLKFSDNWFSPMQLSIDWRLCKIYRCISCGCSDGWDVSLPSAYINVPEIDYIRMPSRQFLFAYGNYMLDSLGVSQTVYVIYHLPFWCCWNRPYW